MAERGLSHMARLDTIVARLMRWTVTVLGAIAVASCVRARSPSVLQEMRGPRRPVNRAIVSGIVQTTRRTPVVAARVEAELFNETARGEGWGNCRGTVAVRREAPSSAAGEFEISIESPGPPFDACLVLRVFPSVATGLRDSSSSGQRFRFEVTREVPTVQVQ